ncbi:MAG: glutamine-hydrolyzing GMP synthase [Chloroflexi bacterium]|nr:glutamine-hydrolyzing GMP synthase [Chloroflexota bacterium]
MDTIIILDYGSQYSQLIARKVRENHVYCELLPWDASADKVSAYHPKGFILSGSPYSVYDPGAPTLPDYILQSGLPVLGICYGMHLLTHALQGKVAPSGEREYGLAQFECAEDSVLFPSGSQQVWMSHGDRTEQPPEGFTVIGHSDNSPIAAIADAQRHYYGLQFHPEVHHTPGGKEILRRFAVDICGAKAEWTAESIIQQAVEKIRTQVGSSTVLSAVSGGVDSSVATALVQKAVGKQLTAVFVNHGLLRKDEPQQVEAALKGVLGINLVTVDAVDKFMGLLKGITNPEEKRRIIGATFIRVFEEHARQIGLPPFLVQGTIYPDVVESSAPDRSKAARIKTHHNVGGLPPDLGFKLVEPLRYLFKDEVRAVGEALGLPRQLVWRQPFPGPGLAVRCLGEITHERLERLRAADAIFTGELDHEGLLFSDQGGSAQAFAVLLPVRSVGVMGDQRTYDETIALRAVSTEDFMTADWMPLPHNLLARVSNRIVNEVAGVNRVVYDITSKPPSTIEWE